MSKEKEEVIPIPDTKPGPGILNLKSESENDNQNDYIGHGTAQDVPSSSTAPVPDVIYDKKPETK